jgi:tetratricopeptide (TPR) repeat protein
LFLLSEVRGSLHYLFFFSATQVLDLYIKYKTELNSRSSQNPTVAPIPLPTVSSNDELKKDEVRDYVAKEVDRSYSRFFNQFNFAVLLIGSSVWLLRRSVIDKLLLDVGGELQQEIQSNSNFLRILKQDVERQKEKEEIFYEMASSTPSEDIFFQDHVNPESLDSLEKLCHKLDSFLKKKSNSKMVLTVRDYILWGNSLYHLAMYYAYSESRIKGQKESIQEEHQLQNDTARDPKKLPQKAVKCHEKAIEKYKEAIAIQNGAYDAWFGKGNAYLQIGMFDDAIRCYDTVIHDIESRPRYVLVDAQVSRGAAERRKGEGKYGDLKRNSINEAIKYCDAAIGLDSSSVRAWYNRACYHALRYKQENERTDKEKAHESLKMVKALAKLRFEKVAVVDSDLEPVMDVVKSLIDPN